MTIEIQRSIPSDTSHDIVGRALASALLIEGQLLLERVSTDDDIELFFETFNHELPDTIKWAGAIFEGIAARRFPDTAMREFYDRTLVRAVNLVQQGSTLAFGNRPGS